MPSRSLDAGAAPFAVAVVVAVAFAAALQELAGNFLKRQETVTIVP